MSQDKQNIDDLVESEVESENDGSTSKATATATTTIKSPKKLAYQEKIAPPCLFFTLGSCKNGTRCTRDHQRKWICKNPDCNGTMVFPGPKRELGACPTHKNAQSAAANIKFNKKIDPSNVAQPAQKVPFRRALQHDIEVSKKNITQKELLRMMLETIKPNEWRSFGERLAGDSSMCEEWLRNLTDGITYSLALEKK